MNAGEAYGCPWCGTAPKLIHTDPSRGGWFTRMLLHESYAVRCVNELCQVRPQTPEFEKRQSAISVWNSQIRRNQNDQSKAD